jgi:type II secretory pathway pseudopilin PulG
MGARGFSLLETLIATTITTVALLGLVQLLTIATRSVQSARTLTMTSVLAQDKMEQLRGLVWAFDASGVAVSDTTSDLTVQPQRPTGGRGLSASPPEALDRNLDGYCDFLDGQGRSLGGGTVPPSGTVYIRRWSVEPLPASPGDSVVLQVRAIRWQGAVDARRAGGGRLPGEARLIGLKTRKAA